MVVSGQSHSLIEGLCGDKWGVQLKMTYIVEQQALPPTGVPVAVQHTVWNTSTRCRKWCSAMKVYTTQFPSPVPQFLVRMQPVPITWHDMGHILQYHGSIRWHQVACTYHPTLPAWQLLITSSETAQKVTLSATINPPRCLNGTEAYCKCRTPGYCCSCHTHHG